MDAPNRSPQHTTCSRRLEDWSSAMEQSLTTRPPDKSAKLNIIFLIFQSKHMLLFTNFAYLERC